MVLPPGRLFSSVRRRRPRSGGFSRPPAFPAGSHPANTGVPAGSPLQRGDDADDDEDEEDGAEKNRDFIFADEVAHEFPCR